MNDRAEMALRNAKVTKEILIAEFGEEEGGVLIKEAENNADRFIAENGFPVQPEDAMNFVMAQLTAFAKMKLSTTFTLAAMTLLTGAINERLHDRAS